MKIPTALLQLARLFPKDAPLYLVGGAVRDGLLGVDSHDYDVCSSLSVDEVKRLIQDTSYSGSGEYPRTGTLVILSSGAQLCEYTTFRKDSYPIGRGDHSPLAVEFTRDINEDAKRRDFTCNAIYYDIVDDRYIDPTDGETSIRERIIYTTREAQETLGEDALRIMRLARLSCELGFHIDPDVMLVAKIFAPQLSDIAVERVLSEYTKIMECDQKNIEYKDNFLPSYGVSILNELGVNELLFGENITFDTLMVMDRLKKQGIYKANLAVKYALLFSQFGYAKVEKIVEKMRFAKALAADILAIGAAFERLRSIDLEELSYSQLKWIVIDNFDYIYGIIGLRIAHDLPCEPIIELLHIVRNLELPTKIGDLKVRGGDVLALGYEGEEVGNILQKLFVRAVDKEEVTYEGQARLLKILAKNKKTKGDK